MPRTRDREIPLRSLAKQLFDALPRQLTRRNAPRTSDPQSADISGNDCIRGLEPNFGALLYLVSLGIVAIATVVVFFGVGFLLLTPPNEQLIAALDTRDRGVEIEHQSFDLAPSPDKNGALSTTQTASASSVSPAKIPARITMSCRRQAGIQQWARLPLPTPERRRRYPMRPCPAKTRRG
jgi:hypothetical protein